MAFIDIFNFKKYFIKPSDSQVARYGHVNGLYEELGPRIKNPGSYSNIGSSSITVPITTYSGVVDLPNFGITTATTIEDPGIANIQLTGDLITSSSIILITPVFNQPDLMVVTPSTISNGSIDIAFYNYSTIEIEGLTFNYLIIN